MADYQYYLVFQTWVARVTDDGARAEYRDSAGRWRGPLAITISGGSATTAAKSMARRRRYGKRVSPSRFSPESGSVRSASR